MNPYITGTAIKQFREQRKLTQLQLADTIGVSDKTISKWETGRGLPDITLLEPLSAALGVSVAELMAGDAVLNTNVSANMKKVQFYVCPVCGNILHASGSAMISCCGITLPPLEWEKPDDDHLITVERVEDEHYVTLNHPMTKQHYISFLAYVTSDRVTLVKLYPEGSCETRFLIRGHGFIYAYCNHHGLFRAVV